MEPVLDPGWMDGNFVVDLPGLQGRGEGGRPMKVPDWSLANCRGLNPDLMHPTRESNSRDEEAARSVCDGCQVKVGCLEWALANNEDQGVWGGESAAARARMRKARRRLAVVG